MDINPSSSIRFIKRPYNSEDREYKDMEGIVHSADSKAKATFYSVKGDPYYYDEHGMKYIVDKNGFKTFFTPNGYPYHKDEAGRLYYFSKEGPLFFQFDSKYNFCPPPLISAKSSNNQDYTPTLGRRTFSSQSDTNYAEKKPKISSKPSYNQNYQPTPGRRTFSSFQSDTNYAEKKPKISSKPSYNQNYQPTLGRRTFSSFQTDRKYAEKNPKIRKLHNRDSINTQIRTRNPWNFDSIEKINDKKILFDITPKNKNIKTPFLSTGSIVRYHVKELEDEKFEFIKLISWNLLNQCEVYPNSIDISKMANNPWLISEGKEEYQFRLYEQLNKTLTIINSCKNLSFFLLQEIDYNSNTLQYNLFFKKLEQLNWDCPITIPTLRKKDVKQIILYNKKYYDCVSRFLLKNNVVITFFDRLNLKKILIGSVVLEENINNEQMSKIMWQWEDSKNSLVILSGIMPNNLIYTYGSMQYSSHRGKINQKPERKSKIVIFNQKNICQLKEMPFYYFLNNNTLSWSEKKISLIEKKLEYRNYLIKAAQKITNRFHGKVLFKICNNFMRLTNTLSNEDNISFFSDILDVTTCSENKEKFNSKYYEYTLSKDELIKLFMKFVDPDYFSLILPINFQYFTTYPKNDLFDFITPWRKRKVKQQYLL